MNILFVTGYYKPAYCYGGPVRSVSRLCETLSSLGARVDVITTNANCRSTLSVPTSTVRDIDGVQVTYYPRTYPFLRNYLYSPALARDCARHVANADIVVLEALYAHSAAAAARACSKHRKPYICSLRGQLLPWALAQKGLKKRVYLAAAGHRIISGAAAVHCAAEAEAQSFHGLGFSTPTFVVPNGIDLSQWNRTHTAGLFRARWEIPDDHLILLFVGRLHRVKRPDIALEAFARAGKSNLHLVFAGPDEEGYAPTLGDTASRFNCRDRVHFAGLLQDDTISAAYADADLLLMPSTMESFGMSALEALASGLPVLTSVAVPVGQWAASAGVGRAVALDVGSFSSAIVEMTRDPSHLRRMGEGARLLAKEHFDSVHVAQEMLRHYESILRTGRPSAR